MGKVDPPVYPGCRRAFPGLQGVPAGPKHEGKSIFFVASLNFSCRNISARGFAALRSARNCQHVTRLTRRTPKSPDFLRTWKPISTVMAVTMPHLSNGHRTFSDQQKLPLRQSERPWGPKISFRKSRFIFRDWSESTGAFGQTEEPAIAGKTAILRSIPTK